LIEISSNGRAAVGLPLAWRFAPPTQGVLQAEDELGKAGAARCRVLQVNPNGRAMGTIECEVDLARLVGRRLGLRMAPWQWTFEMPCVENTVVVLADLVEAIDAQPPPEEVFWPNFEAWARGEKLGCAKLGAASVRGDYLYQLRVTGEIRVSLTKTAEGGVQARGDGEVRIVDHETGAVLYRYAPGALVRSRDPAQGKECGQLALRETAADALLQLGTRLRALLPTRP
jgi:hypothetical protein